MKNNSQPQLIWSFLHEILALSKPKRKQIDDFSKKLLSHHYFPIIFRNISLPEIILNKEDLYDKFTKMFISFSSIKVVPPSGLTFDLNESMVIVFRGNVLIEKVKNKFNKLNNNNHPDSGAKLDANGKLHEFRQSERINFPIENFHPLVEAKPTTNTLPQVIEIALNEVERLQTEIIKENQQMKKKFISDYLFCGKKTLFSLKAIFIEEYDKLNEPIELKDDRIQLIYSGSALFMIRVGKVIKYQSQLVQGCILSTQLIKRNTLNVKHQNKSQSFLYKSKKCKIISILLSEFLRGFRFNEEIEDSLRQKINETQKNRCQFIRKAQALEERKKSNLSAVLELNVGVVLKKSKAFRVKSQLVQQQYDNFMTLNKYDVMTRSKENVERLIDHYSEFNQSVREARDKIQREKSSKYIKSIDKKAKKNIKNLRMKKSKIESIAIKQAIQNTERYRDRPEDIKFIFQDDIKQIKYEQEIYNFITRKKTKAKTEEFSQTIIPFSTKSMPFDTPIENPCKKQ